MYGTYCRLNLHVFATNRDVIRALRRKLKHDALRDPTKREARKTLYREILKQHHQAQGLVRHFRL